MFEKQSVSGADQARQSVAGEAAGDGPRPPGHRQESRFILSGMGTR